MFILGRLLDFKNINSASHCLEDLGRKQRRRCVKCYEILQKENGRLYAQRKCPQSRYKCNKCYQHFCIDCFYKSHNYDDLQWSLYTYKINLISLCLYIKRRCFPSNTWLWMKSFWFLKYWINRYYNVMWKKLKIMYYHHEMKTWISSFAKLVNRLDRQWSP